MKTPSSRSFYLRIDKKGHGGGGARGENQDMTKCWFSTWERLIRPSWLSDRFEAFIDGPIFIQLPCLGQEKTSALVCMDHIFI